jgi:clan AA aspartic protease (TIGR02281 family)
MKKRYARQQKEGLLADNRGRAALKERSSVFWAVILFSGAVFSPALVFAQGSGAAETFFVVQESEMIRADRQALKEALKTGRSSKIIAAKAQLSDDLAREQAIRRRDATGIIVPLIADDEGHFFVDVLINNSTHARLMVDTGSPVVLLSSRFLAKLSQDSKRITQGSVTVLNGKHDAVEVSLKSLKMGVAEGRNITADIMLSPNKELEDKFKDGLLGASFFSRFHLTVDQKNRRLILHKAD